MLRRSAALALLALAACREPPPPLTSCADSLEGVWRTTDAPPRRYHILDHGATVEAFPMWDTTRLADGRKAVLPPDPDAALADTDLPVRSPVRIQLDRRGETVAGTASYRLRAGGRDCTVSGPARLTACAGASAVLSTRLPGTGAAEADCAAAAPGNWSDVPLVRE